MRWNEGGAQDGHLPDPRAAQISRLKDDNGRLRERLRERDQQVAELTDFKTLVVLPRWLTG